MDKDFGKSKNKVEEIVEVPENVKVAVNRVLSELPNHKFNPGVDIDQQCMDRFGMNWDDVCKSMYEKISGGLELVPGQARKPEGAFIRPKVLAAATVGKTGNWMTNRFAEVVYLSYTKPGWAIKSFLEDLKKSPELVSEDGFVSAGNHLRILEIASDIAPEKVEEILKSYGLETKKE